MKMNGVSFRRGAAHAHCCTQAMELFLGMHQVEGGGGERTAYDPTALATPYADTTLPLLAQLSLADQRSSQAGLSAGAAHGGSAVPEPTPQEEEEEERAAALLARLPLRTHDGVVGVQADLQDLLL